MEPAINKVETPRIPVARRPARPTGERKDGGGGRKFFVDEGLEPPGPLAEPRSNGERPVGEAPEDESGYRIDVTA